LLLLVITCSVSFPFRGFFNMETSIENQFWN
jgi:hypothetical protein